MKMNIDRVISLWLLETAQNLLPRSEIVAGKALVSKNHSGCAATDGGFMPFKIALHELDPPAAPLILLFCLKWNLQCCVQISSASHC